MIDERHSGVLSVVAVAGYAVMREGFFAFGQSFGIAGERIVLALVADEDVVLYESHCPGLELAGSFGFAAGEQDGKQHED